MAVCIMRRMAIAPMIIRWGPDASSDMLRRAARCSKCGAKGATLMFPSWVSSTVGLAPFTITIGRCSSFETTALQRRPW
jgi:hypothetical protein